MYVSMKAARNISVIPRISIFVQFCSTFLNGCVLIFSCIIPLDSVAPAIAVKMNPALSGMRCISATLDSVVAFDHLTNISVTNAANSDVEYMTMNIAPAP